jgi:pentapeptide repeat protein
LNVLVHYKIAVSLEWLDRPGEWGPGELASEIWKGVSEPGAGPRRYQTTVRQGAREWTLFAPSGPRPDYLEFYAARINAAGWRDDPFPAGTAWSGIDLRKTSLALSGGFVIVDDSNLSDARLTFDSIIWRGTTATGLQLYTSSVNYALWFFECDLSSSGFQLAPNGFAKVFNRCNLNNVNFDFADLSNASFRNSPTEGATFKNALLEGADFDEVSRPPLPAQSAASSSS